MPIQAVAMAARAAARAAAKAGQAAKKGAQAARRARRSSDDPTKTLKDVAKPQEKLLKEAMKRKKEILVLFLISLVTQVFTLFVFALLLITPILVIYDSARSIVNIPTNAYNAVAGNSGGRGPVDITGEEYLCPLKPIPDWSKKSIEEQPEPECYAKNLKISEQETGVPWRIIAAVDFKNLYDSGTPDDRQHPIEGSKDRLIEIGKNLQLANARRNESGKLYYDMDGNLQKILSPDETYSAGQVERFLTDYHCLYEKKAGEEWCFSAKYAREKNSFYAKSGWVLGGYKDQEEKLGALGWYKNQVDGYGQKCDWYTLFEEKRPGPSPGGHLSKVPLYLQGDPRWGGQGYACETIAYAGCGPTSLSMVLSYYLKKEILPSEVAQKSEEAGGAVCNQGSANDMFEKVAPKYGLVSSPLSDWGDIVAHLKKGEPIIQNVHLGGFLHFHVLTGIDEGRGVIFVNDPAKGEYEESISSLQGRWNNSYARYVHP